MSDTHPRYIVAQRLVLADGVFVSEFSVVDAQPDAGNGRVLHVGFDEGDAARVSEALNEAQRVEALEAEVHRMGVARERQRQITADELASLREELHAALTRLADIDPAPKGGQ